MPEYNKIVPFEVKFRKEKGDAQRQANEIIAEFERRLSGGATGVAITYSANNVQAEAIIKEYEEKYKKDKEFEIKGDFQARVMKLVYKEIKKRNWQDKAHILPIATCQDLGGGGAVTMKEVKRDLDNIAKHLGADWQVLGLQNQNANGKKYAVGGKVSETLFVGELKAHFENSMIKLTNGEFSNDEELLKAYTKGEKDGVPSRSDHSKLNKAPQKVAQEKVDQGDKLELFRVDSKDANAKAISLEDQAAKIIAKFEERLKDPTAKVAFTYSKNEEQDKVMDIVEKKIKDKWKDRVAILPIPTSSNPTIKEAKDDMGNIAQHLGAGWQVLCYLQNQDTIDNKTFALGEPNSDEDGTIKRIFDEGMENMTNGEFTVHFLKDAYEKGQAERVVLTTNPKIDILAHNSNAVPVNKPPSDTTYVPAFNKVISFPLGLTSKLDSLFPENNWKIESNDREISVTNKSDQTKQVRISKEEDGAFHFSTTHEGATDALYKSTAAIKQDDELEYDIEMTSHFDWKEELKKMHDNDIDIENIKSLKANGTEISREDLKSRIQEIKQEARQASRSLSN